MGWEKWKSWCFKTRFSSASPVFGLAFFRFCVGMDYCLWLPIKERQAGKRITIFRRLLEAALNIVEVN